MGSGSHRKGLVHEAINEVTETALFVLGDQKLTNAKEARLIKILTGLSDADQVATERAANRVLRAEAELREARQEFVVVTQTNEQVQEVLVELLSLCQLETKTLHEGEAEIARIGSRNGADYIRPELAGPGEVKAAVERRKQLRENAEITSREAEAL